MLDCRAKDQPRPQPHGMAYACTLVEMVEKVQWAPVILGEVRGMVRINLVGVMILACVFVVSVLFSGRVMAGQGLNYGLPQGVYIDLTREFYEALKAEGGTGNKTYTNSMSQEYLRQIAVSSKFMVETNLRILKNQEKIINLLESILREQRKNLR